MSGKNSRFTLHLAGPSPFARKVQAVAIELGVDSRMDLEPLLVAPGKENVDYARSVNPLKRVPALTLDDGTTLLDSSLICQYLDETEGGSLVPRDGAQRWIVLNVLAVANGLMEVSVQLRYETFARPEDHRWGDFIADLEQRILNALDWLDARADALSHDDPDLAGLACVIAVEYIDFRFPDMDWREGRPALQTLHQALAHRSSLAGTRPDS